MNGSTRFRSSTTKPRNDLECKLQYCTREHDGIKDLDVVTSLARSRSGCRWLRSCATNTWTPCGRHWQWQCMPSRVVLCKSCIYRYGGSHCYTEHTLYPKMGHEIFVFLDILGVLNSWLLCLGRGRRIQNSTFPTLLQSQREASAPWAWKIAL